MHHLFEMMPSLYLVSGQKFIKMKEDFLHYIWRFQKFETHGMKTSQGDDIQVISVGQYNSHSGPDFLDARIKIGGTLWAGHVEIHINSSDWISHKHQLDKAYDNVILHVVFNDDQKIFRISGTQIPSLGLKQRIFPKMESKYLKLLNNKYWIPCQHQFHKVSVLKKTIWYDRLLIERLEQKTAQIQILLNQNHDDWEKTFFQVLANNFGLKVNQLPFELLSKSIDLNVIAKHKDNEIQIAAIIFGQSGLLNDSFSEEYPKSLKREYQFLKAKYRLTPIQKESWRFLRLRPQNFPTIRLAQFAKLLFQETHLFSRMLSAVTIKEIDQIFDIQLPDYWNTHFVFEKASQNRQKHLGKSMIRLIVINTIVPFLFLYGKLKAVTEYQDKAMMLLESIKVEDNSIISNWKKLGENPKTAYDSQALLQLKNEYCNEKKCLKCSIGNAILSESPIVLSE